VPNGTRYSPSPTKVPSISFVGKQPVVVTRAGSAFVITRRGRSFEASSLPLPDGTMIASLVPYVSSSFADLTLALTCDVHLCRASLTLALVSALTRADFCCRQVSHWAVGDDSEELAAALGPCHGCSAACYVIVCSPDGSSARTVWSDDRAARVGGAVALRTGLALVASPDGSAFEVRVADVVCSTGRTPSVLSPAHWLARLGVHGRAGSGGDQGHGLRGTGRRRADARTARGACASRVHAGRAAPGCAGGSACGTRLATCDCSVFPLPYPPGSIVAASRAHRVGSW
jgi:hypothetical protein